MQKGTLCFNNTWHAVISNTHDHQVPSPDGPTRWQHPHYTSSSVTYTTSCNKTSQLTRSNSETVLSAIDLLFPRKNSRSQPFSLFYLSNQYDYSFENIDPIITIHVPILFGQRTRTVQQFYRSRETSWRAKGSQTVGAHQINERNCREFLEARNECLAPVPNHSSVGQHSLYGKGEEEEAKFSVVNLCGR